MALHKHSDGTYICYCGDVRYDVDEPTAKTRKYPPFSYEKDVKRLATLVQACREMRGKP